MSAPTRTKAARGAYQLVSLAIRNVMRRLDKLAKGGLMAYPEQSALLVSLADRAPQMAESKDVNPYHLGHPCCSLPAFSCLRDEAKVSSMLPSLSVWSDVLKIIVPVIVASGLAFFGNRKLEHLKKDIQNMLAERARRTDFLRSQIEKLYGPLSFYLDLNSQNLALHAAIIGMDTSSPQSRLTSEEIDQVITAINLYARRTSANNEAIADLLRAQWAWLDTDDSEVMVKHVFAHIRETIEFNLANKAKLPLEYYQKGPIEPPTVHSTVLADRIRKKLQEKQLELSGLVRAVTTTRDEH